MIRKILYAYRMNAKIGRKEFITALIPLIFGYLFFYFVGENLWSSYGDLDVYYLIAQSTLELLFWIFLAALSVARLKDMGWPKYLALAYIPLWFFGKRNLVIYDLLWNNSEGLTGMWLLWLPVILSVTCLVVLAALAAMPTRD
ncbi:hypothetical protein [Sedimenticola sp.]|uniref:hypothetical protein n=1 Tax=Sedimenticola sp. TaxID=1940285 RepID=UPI003D123B51